MYKTNFRFDGVALSNAIEYLSTIQVMDVAGKSKDEIRDTIYKKCAELFNDHFSIEKNLTISDFHTSPCQQMWKGLFCDFVGVFKPLSLDDHYIHHDLIKLDTVTSTYENSYINVSLLVNLKRLESFVVESQIPETLPL